MSTDSGKNEISNNLHEKALTPQQQLMQSYYQFPIHHIPTWDGKLFSQAKNYPWGFEYLSYTYFIIDKLKEVNFHSLIDIGCGDGRFLSEVSQRFGEKHLYGIDYSEAAIRLAQALVPNVTWIHGNITCKSSLPQAFDVVTLIETLEHIPVDEVSTFINRISQCLNENGQLLLTVPSITVPVTAHHELHFSYDSLHSVLNPAFIIEEVYYLNRNWRTLRKFIVNITGNGSIIINNARLLGLMFSQYQKRFLIGTKKNSRRIFLRCTKRNS